MSGDAITMTNRGVEGSFGNYLYLHRNVGAVYNI